MTARGIGSALIIVSATCCAAADTAGVTVEGQDDPPPPPPSGGAAPRYGDNSSDRIIWREDWESYGDIYDTYPTWRYGSFEIAETDLDQNGGVGGSTGFRWNVPSGTGGPLLERDVDGSPTHFFMEYDFRIEQGAEPTYGKWLIIHHDAEGRNSSCTDDDGNPSLARHQFGFNRKGYPAYGDPDHARFGARGEQPASCDGPLTNDSYGWFTWGGDRHEPAPVLSQDPDIGKAPWSPVNDGNWHRHTIEIKTGNGTGGYVRLWLDGHLYWDSSSNSMNHPGRVDRVLWDMVSGSSKLSSYTWWLDNITVWRR